MKIKILHIEDWFNPETGYQINFFARNHNPNIDFHILASNSYEIWGQIKVDDNIRKKDIDFEQKYNVKIHRLESKIKGKKHNRWLKGLNRKIDQIKPDIIFAHSLESFTALRVILSFKNRKKYKIVADTHTLYSQFGKGFAYKLFIYFLRHIVTPVIKRNNICVFFTAEENKQILQDTYKIPEKLIKNSTIGTDLQLFRYDENEAKNIRTIYDIPENAFLIIYTGKFNDLKQPHILLEAMCKISQDNVYLLMVGAKDADYYKQKCLPLIENRDKIIIVDNQKNTDLYKYYSAADLAVFPKQNTLSAIDVQACRLPLIMENDYTNKIRLAHGGLLYEPNNVNNLAKIITNFISDKDKQLQLSNNGFEFISENYDYKKILKNVEDILLSLKS